MSNKDTYRKSELRSQITSLLEAVQELIKLPLCINDDLNILGLPPNMRLHSNPFCMKTKRNNHPRCIAFCRRHIDKISSHNKNGIIIKCPFNGIQIIAPIFLNGIFTGNLFAGPHCYANKKTSPKFSQKHLENLRHLVASLARDISSLASLDTKQKDVKSTRHNQIMTYIFANLHEGATLEGLAGELHLSVSRTSHCVKEVTHMDFTKLVNLIRKNRAARLILAGDLSMSEIAYELGFCDQSHFTKFFKSQFNTTPTRYRKDNSNSAL